MSHSDRDDYWVIETCPDCYGTLNPDGTHWANGQRECWTVHLSDRPLPHREAGDEE